MLTVTFFPRKKVTKEILREIETSRKEHPPRMPLISAVTIFATDGRANGQPKSKRTR
jgi:hypothetical protein